MVISSALRQAEFPGGLRPRGPKAGVLRPRPQAILGERGDGDSAAPCPRVLTRLRTSCATFATLLHLLPGRFLFPASSRKASPLRSAVMNRRSSCVSLASVSNLLSVGVSGAAIAFIRCQVEVREHPPEFLQDSFLEQGSGAKDERRTRARRSWSWLAWSSGAGHQTEQGQSEPTVKRRNVARISRRQPNSRSASWLRILFGSRLAAYSTHLVIEETVLTIRA